MLDTRQNPNPTQAEIRSTGERAAVEVVTNWTARGGLVWRPVAATATLPLAVYAGMKVARAIPTTNPALTGLKYVAATVVVPWFLWRQVYWLLVSKPIRNEIAGEVAAQQPAWREPQINEAAAIGLHSTKYKTSVAWPWVFGGAGFTLASLYLIQRLRIHVALTNLRRRVASADPLPVDAVTQQALAALEQMPEWGSLSGEARQQRLAARVERDLAPYRKRRYLQVNAFIPEAVQNVAQILLWNGDVNPVTWGNDDLYIDRAMGIVDRYLEGQGIAIPRSSPDEAALPDYDTLQARSLQAYREDLRTAARR